MPILIALAVFAFAILAIVAGVLLAVAEAIANHQPAKKPRRRASNKMHRIHREISPEEFEELTNGGTTR